MSYKLTSTGAVVRLADGAEIPADPSNVDRARYQAWLEAGGLPVAADALSIDAQIAEMYAEKGVNRGFTELAWAIALICELQNTQIDQLVAEIRQIGGPSFSTFDVPRVPNLKANKGMKDSKALIDATGALRAQKT